MNDVKRKREQRKLFFWTVRQALAIVLLATWTVEVVVATASGDPTSAERLLRLIFA